MVAVITPQGGPDDCFTAQTVPGIMENGPVNPDIGGLVVKLATIINNFLLSILLRWSNESYLEAVYGHYSQIFPILLSTAASIPHRQLSLFEGNTALIMTASPMSIYLSCLAYYRTFENPRSAFRFADHTGEVFARWLGILLPFLWWSLNFVVSFSTQAFSNSELCRGMTFQKWANHVITTSFVGIFDVMGVRDLYIDFVSRGGLGTASLVTLWVWSIYFIRHLDPDILDLYNERTWMESTKPLSQLIPIKWLMIPTRFGRAVWDIIAKRHPWLVTITISCFHWHWLLCVIKGTPIQKYDLSYGQILAAFSVFPAMVGIVKLASAKCKSRLSEESCIRLDPRSMWIRFEKGLRFFLVGNASLPYMYSPDSDRQSSTLPRFISFLDLRRPRSRIVYFLFPLCSLLASSIHAYLMTSYVIAGTLPNVKNFMNHNHALWKPLSVTLYVSGFVIGWFNAYVWAFYPHLRRNVRDILEATSPRRYTRLFSMINILVVLPIAILMCAGPLFSPYAALSLTQEHQWNHRCDAFGGAAVLDGSDSSLALYTSLSKQGSPSAVYTMEKNDDTWTMRQNLSITIIDVLASPSRLPLWVSYDEAARVISADCSVAPCLRGNYSTQRSLTLEFRLDQNTSVLYSKEAPWKYPNDAPSFILLRQVPDQEDHPIAMETAVTKPTYCQQLKVCLGKFPLELDVFAALGVVLIAQRNYANYCAPPKLYTTGYGDAIASDPVPICSSRG